jgi:hypothetical protein
MNPLRGLMVRGRSPNGCSAAARLAAYAYDTLMNHVLHFIYREIAKYHDAYLAQRINNDSVCIGNDLMAMAINSFLLPPFRFLLWEIQCAASSFSGSSY